mgnify:CR=1 FL=1
MIIIDHHIEDEVLTDYFFIEGTIDINSEYFIEKIKKDYYLEGKVLIEFDSENGLFPATDFEFDNSEIKKDYDLQFTDLDDGIKQYIEWIENYE